MYSALLVFPIIGPTSMNHRRELNDILYQSIYSRDSNITEFQKVLQVLRQTVLKTGLKLVYSSSGDFQYLSTFLESKTSKIQKTAKKT